MQVKKKVSQKGALILLALPRDIQVIILASAYLGNGARLLLVRTMFPAKGRLSNILCAKATEKCLEDIPATRLLR